MGGGSDAAAAGRRFGSEPVRLKLTDTSTQQQQISGNSGCTAAATKKDSIAATAATEEERQELAALRQRVVAEGEAVAGPEVFASVLEAVRSSAVGQGPLLAAAGTDGRAATRAFMASLGLSGMSPDATPKAAKGGAAKHSGKATHAMASPPEKYRGRGRAPSPAGGAVARAPMPSSSSLMPTEAEMEARQGLLLHLAFRALFIEGQMEQIGRQRGSTE